MCTVILSRQSDADWPVVIAANRDEMLSRAWRPPGRHWPDLPEIIAGYDEEAGGSWMGLNDTGVVACILNRHGSLGPAPGKRSRGELVIDALTCADAVEAADALRHLNPQAYRPFNLLIADNRDAFWLRLAEGADRVDCTPLEDGVFMLTAGDVNDPAEARIRDYLPEFRKAPRPIPGEAGWAHWQRMMGRGPAQPGDGSPDAVISGLCFRLPSGFGTSSSSLLALPSVESALMEPRISPVWQFAAGPPDTTAFRPVPLFP